MKKIIILTTFILMFLFLGCTKTGKFTYTNDSQSLSKFNFHSIDFNANPKLVVLNYKNLNLGSNQFDFDSSRKAITSVDLRYIKSNSIEGNLIKVYDWEGTVSCLNLHYPNSFTKFKVQNGDVFCLKTDKENYVKVMIGVDKDNLYLYWVKQEDMGFSKDFISPKLLSHYYSGGYVYLNISEPVNPKKTHFRSNDVEYILPNLIKVKSNGNVEGKVYDLSGNVLSLSDNLR